MALRPCRSCAHMVDPRAFSCPNCGVPDPGKGYVGRHKLLVFGGGGLLAYGLASALMMGGGLDSPQPTSATSETEEDRTVSLEERRRAFGPVKDSVLSEAASLTSRGEYLAALRLMVYWRDIGDKDLTAAFTKAQALKSSQDEEELAAAARRIPASDLEANRKAYTELARLAPENEHYKERLAYYQNQLRARRQEQGSRIERFGPLPQKSAWDGTYSEVKTYLSQVANDPSSIDVSSCTDVYHIDTGWLVGCDYRGANAFGGIVRQSNWFTIVHGRVIEMEEASKYSPR